MLRLARCIGPVLAEAASLMVNASTLRLPGCKAASSARSRFRPPIKAVALRATVALFRREAEHGYLR